MGNQDGPGRYVRVVTNGKTLPLIEADVARATREGARALMSTAEGLSDLDTGRTAATRPSRHGRRRCRRNTGWN